MTYEADGFCDKNRDVLFKDCIELMKGSQKYATMPSSMLHVGDKWVELNGINESPEEHVPPRSLKVMSPSLNAFK